MSCVPTCCVHDNLASFVCCRILRKWREWVNEEIWLKRSSVDSIEGGCRFEELTVGDSVRWSMEGKRNEGRREGRTWDAWLVRAAQWFETGIGSGFCLCV